MGKCVRKQIQDNCNSRVNNCAHYEFILSVSNVWKKLIIQ